MYNISIMTEIAINMTAMYAGWIFQLATSISIRPLS